MLNMLSGKKADVGYKRKKLKRALNTSSTSDVIEMEVECCEGMFFNWYNIYNNFKCICVQNL